MKISLQRILIAATLVLSAGIANTGFAQSCGGWYASAEATYLAPLYDGGASSFTLIDGNTGDLVTTGPTTETAEDLTAAPRITLGRVLDNGIGVQFRYWELNNAVSNLDLPDPITGNQIQSLGGNDSFEAYTIDLELTKGFCYGKTDFLGTFGVRHGRISHTRQDQVIGTVNGSAYNLGATTGEEFDGTGLTSSLSMVREINQCRGLGVYVNLRGSVLFGEAETLAITQSSVGAGPFGSSNSVNGAISRDDEAGFIGEVGAGLQFSRCVRNSSNRMFARVGVEYQYWGSDQGDVLANSTTGVLVPGFASLGTATATGGEQDYNLIGLAFATGFTW